MLEFHYALGLDIGIGSVGWAVLRNQPNGEPDRIQDWACVFLTRRSSQRQVPALRPPAGRKKRPAPSAPPSAPLGTHPLPDGAARHHAGCRYTGHVCRRWLPKIALPAARRVTGPPAHQGGSGSGADPSCPARGYKSNSTAEAAKDEKETGKVKTAIEENRRCMAEHGYRTVGEMMYRDERFWQKHPDGTRYHQTRNKAEDYGFGQ